LVREAQTLTMPTEIQWRLREPERQKKDDARWRTHSTVAAQDADELVKVYNLYNHFFEYRAVTVKKAAPEKPKGPFGFDFKNRGISHAK
jgi:hypothetical protein